jgi:hypothetical protein
MLSSKSKTKRVNPRCNIREKAQMRCKGLDRIWIVLLFSIHLGDIRSNFNKIFTLTGNNRVTINFKETLMNSRITFPIIRQCSAGFLTEMVSVKMEITVIMPMVFKTLEDLS